MCQQQVFKMATFRVDARSGQFYCTYRNGRVPHHVGSTHDGICEEECCLRVLIVYFTKVRVCHSSAMQTSEGYWQMESWKSHSIVTVVNEAHIDILLTPYEVRNLIPKLT